MRYGEEHPYSPLKFLKKTKLVEILSVSEKNTTEVCSGTESSGFSSYNVLRVCQRYHFLNISSLFAPDWFADALFANFGLPF